MRATPIILFFYTCLIPVLLKSQLQLADGTQLKVLFPPSRPETSSSSEHFKQRFQQRAFREIELLHTELYSMKGVKRILVFDGRSKLQYSFEFDTAGKIIRYGRLGDFYFTIESNHTIDSLHRFSSLSYYDAENKLMRSDTAYSETRRYSHADTVINMQTNKHVVYKRGSLVNEQNRYFNEKWLRERVELSGTFDANYVPYLKYIGKEYYLEDYLKTKYKSDSLYSCKAQDFDQHFWGTAGKARASIPDPSLIKHAFFKANKLKYKKKFLVDGEDFEEPFYFYSPQYCYTALDRLRMASDERGFQSYRYSVNERGLYDTCYFLYYPLERTPLITKQDSAKRAEIADQIKKGTRIVLDPSQYSGEWQRANTPTKSLKFTFQYEYFEERKKMEN